MSTQGQGDVVERLALCITSQDTMDDVAMRDAIAEITRLRALLSSSRGEQGWRTMDSAPTDGTHIIGNTQWGAREIWWHKDTYEGEYWTDEGDSEPEPTGWIPMPGPIPTSLAGQGTDDTKEEAAVAYFRSAIADGQAAILLADLATYDNVLRELGIQESHKHPVDEVRRIQRIAETAHPQGVEAAAKLIDRKVSDYTSEHGSLDPETGAMEFSRSGEEYVSTLEELAEEIRAINTAAPQPTAGGDAPVLAERAREIADRWFDSRGQQGGVHHSRAELAEQLVRALSAERARVIALETALRGAIANLEHVSVFDEADDDDQEAIEARSAWQRDLDRFRAALRALSQQDTGGAK